MFPDHLRRLPFEFPGSTGAGPWQEWVAIPFSRVSSLTQASNLGLPHCWWILYHLSTPSYILAIRKWQLENKSEEKKWIYKVISASHKCLLFSHSVISYYLWPHELQHTRLPCPSLSPAVCSNSCPLSRSNHLILFSSSPQSFPNMLNHRKLTTLITGTTALSNSMKL